MTNSVRPIVPGAVAVISVLGGTLAIGGAPVGATNVIVTNSNPAGAGSLQEAIMLANSHGGESTITFAATVGPVIELRDPGGTMSMRITDDLRIIGPGVDELRIINNVDDVLFAYGASLYVTEVTIGTADGSNITSEPLTAGSPPATLTLKSVELYGATRDAVDVEASAGVSIIDSVISGAASGLEVDDSLTAIVMVTNSTFSNLGGYGIDVQNINQVLVSDSKFGGIATTAVKADTTLKPAEISNVNISNADEGLEFADVPSVEVINSTIEASDTALDVDNASTLVVDALTATGASEGIFADNVGRVDITNSQLSGVRDAIDIDTADTANISTVTITESTRDAIHIDTANTANISSVTITEAQDGIDINSVGDASISTVTITDNAGGAIDVNTVSGLIVIEDVTIDGTDDGVTINDAADAAVADTKITGLADDGIRLRSNGTMRLDRIDIDGGDQAIDVDRSTKLSIDAVSVADVESGIKISRVDEVIVSDLTLTGIADDAVRVNESNTTELTDVTIETAGERALYVGLYAESSVDLVNVTTSGATSRAVHLQGRTDTTASITDSRFDNQVLASGVTDLTVDSTVIESSGRVGLSLYGVVNTSLRNSTISGSTRAGVQSASYSGEPESLLVENSTVSGNSGSGLVGDAGEISIVNSTFSGNGDVDFPEIAMYDTAAATINHSTIVSDEGPAFTTTNAGSIALDHVVVDGAVSASSALSATRSVVPVGTSLGTSNIETDDPVLGPLADNGGPTLTHLPLVGSPTLDAGDPAIAAQPATDQRGELRLSGEAIDIGAVEREVEIEVEAISAVVSLDPGRFVDTRATGETIDGELQAGGRRTDGTTLTFQVAGRGQVPSDAVGVIANVTAVGPIGNGFVTMHPCLEDPPLTSSLNFVDGIATGNEVIAGLSGDGGLCAFVRGNIDLVVDIVGYIPAGSSYASLDPARMVDTRATGETIDGELQAGGRRTDGSELIVQIAGRADVPDGAAAVVVNITAIAPAGVGFVTSHPCLDAPPLASSLNFVAGVTRGNEIVAPLDDDGNICLFVRGDTHLSVDIAGYLPSDPSLLSIAPARFLDTRSNGETIDGEFATGGKRASGEELTLSLAGRGEIPADATAVIANVTAIGPESVGFVTVHPCSASVPLASSLNFVPGVSGGNEIIARLDDNGALCLFNQGTTHLAVDVVAYLR